MNSFTLKAPSVSANKTPKEVLPAQSSWQEKEARIEDPWLSTIQSNPTVNATDAPYKKEIAAVPEKAFLSLKSQATDNFYTIQRAPQKHNGIHLKLSSDKFIQHKCAACNQEEKVQRVASGSSTPVSDTIAHSISTSKGSGASLDAKTNSFMSSRLGADFSNVSIHTNTNAVQLNRQLNAKAFTVGSDVFFNEGQYNPSSVPGMQLLAHELTHVVQQGGSKPNAVMRKVDEAGVEAEFNTWADANKRTKDKTHSDFPWAAWDFVRPQIVDAAMQPLPKPTDKAGLEKWNDNFSKAEIVGKWIATLRNTTTNDTIKSDAESKIYFIADSLVKAGLISKGMAQAANTGDKEKALVYATVLSSPSSASAAELDTIFTFQMNGQSDPAQVPFIKTLCLTDGNSLQTMDAARTQAMFKAIQAKYPGHSKVVQAMAATLIFNTAVRTSIADAMMAGTLGTPELLFKVLTHPYFKDPDYAGAVLINNPNNDVDLDTAKHWKDDMPFAIQYKQKYYVKYLVDLAAKQSVVIAPPANYTATSLRGWLDANTEKIAGAAALEYPTNNDAIFTIYRNIADIFFYHVDHDKNAIPDNEGKLAKLGVGGKPAKSRIEADCDVFATYAMRLYNSAGFQPIGYLGMYPTGSFSGRAAHAAALIRKANVYYIINNKNMFDSGITETKTDEKKEEAITEMRDKSIADAYGNPLPKTWEMYYADAEANGKLPADFLSKPAKFRKPSLE